MFATSLVLLALNLAASAVAHGADSQSNSPEQCISLCNGGTDCVAAEEVARCHRKPLNGEINHQHSLWTTLKTFTSTSTVFETASSTSAMDSKSAASSTSNVPLYTAAAASKAIGTSTASVSLSSRISGSSALSTASSSSVPSTISSSSVTESKSTAVSSASTYLASQGPVTTTSTYSATPTSQISATTLLTMVSSASASPTPVPMIASYTGKRGLAYNDATLARFFSLDSAHITWAYNWGSHSDGLTSAVKYIPMLWGTGQDKTNMWQTNAQNAINAGSDALLSFNEPDNCIGGTGGSCMSVGDAVSGYLTHMNPFAGEAKLGAPAVTSGVSPMGLSWLSSFLASCTGCTIDFIPIHWYGEASAAEWFKIHVQNAYSAGGNRPIWITEFGCTTGTDEEKAAFLQSVLPWLDSQDYVQRYAYFMASPGVLVTSDGSGLSSLGNVYKSI